MLETIYKLIDPQTLKLVAHMALFSALGFSAVQKFRNMDGLKRIHNDTLALLVHVPIGVFAALAGFYPMPVNLETAAQKAVGGAVFGLFAWGVSGKVHDWAWARLFPEDE